MTLYAQAAERLTVDHDKLVEAAEMGRDLIFMHMQEESPYEAVGLLWSDGSISPMINQARSSSRFAIGPTQLAETLAMVDPEDKTLVGFYHSHPGDNANLSKEDRDTLRAQTLLGVAVPWLIATPATMLVAWWWDSDYRGPVGMVLYPEMPGG